MGKLKDLRIMEGLVNVMDDDKIIIDLYKKGRSIKHITNTTQNFKTKKRRERINFICTAGYIGLFN